MTRSLRFFGLFATLKVPSVSFAMPTAPALRTAPVERPGLFGRLAGLFGGPPVLAGLGTAAVFGLALGYISPTTLDYLTGGSTDTAEFFPEADFLTTEG